MDSSKDPQFITASDSRAQTKVPLWQFCSLCTAAVRRPLENIAQTLKIPSDPVGAPGPTVTTPHSSIRQIQDSVKSTNCHLCTHILTSLSLSRANPGLSEAQRNDGLIITLSSTWNRTSSAIAPRDIRLNLACASQPAATVISLKSSIVYSGERVWDLCLETPSIAAKSTACDLSFARAKKWLQKCLSSHSMCRRLQTAMKETPTRLLYLADPAVVRLVATPTSPTVPELMALSHCWGAVVPYKLTKETRAQLEAGLPVTSLPKSFRDAIHAARQLGCMYIWIDSLCIVQDDADDWAIESKKMGSIYRRSLCTLAAIASKDSSQGCFLLTDPLTTNDVRLWQDSEAILYLRGHSLDVDTETKPLTTRAWVFQESLLATRTLSFTRNGLQWNCMDMHRGENLPLSRLNVMLDVSSQWQGLVEYDTALLKYAFYQAITRVESADITLAPSSAYELAMLDDDADEEMDTQVSNADFLFGFWLGILRVYTSLQITFVSDRLPAIMGIVAQLEPACKTTAWFGHWPPLWPNDLLWTANPRLDIDLFDMDSAADDGPLVHLTKTLSNEKVPSWSWAAIDGPLAWLVELPCASDVAELVTAPSQQIDSRCMSVRGYHVVYPEECRDTCDVDVLLDDPGDSLPQSDVFLLLLLRANKTDYGLVLTPCAWGEPLTFTRLGAFRQDTDAEDAVFNSIDKMQKTVVHLV